MTGSGVGNIHHPSRAQPANCQGLKDQASDQCGGKDSGCCHCLNVPVGWDQAWIRGAVRAETR